MARKKRRKGYRQKDREWNKFEAENNEYGIPSKTRREVNKMYKEYVKQYTEKEAYLQGKGYEMNQPMLSRRQFVANRITMMKDDIKAGKKPINLTRRMVDEQAFEFSYKTALAWRQNVMELQEDATVDLPEGETIDLSEYNLLALRAGAIDASDIYKKLKLAHPDWNGKDYSDWMSENIFGSL